ncbi:MAG: CoA-binding protein [Caldilineaceae bacterium]|nr:CoA-binding protein [Caldilineaceae bacterium]MBP8106053.1 CoA-binding protein [Caldilineaceae bacterium]MBP8121941.1 CoA-binding protein [Caldilineaceae bacterium]MBP9073371.1 CoA-binding protein [Caldilineaceae bacterium]
MADLIQFYAQEPVWAVVGASNDRRKYGNRIYRTLRSAGYTVYAINDHESQVEGDTAYARLADLPQIPTVVDMVIPPWNAQSVVEEAVTLGVKALWFQPGAENPAAIRWAKEQGLDVIEDCILVHHVQQSATTSPPPSLPQIGGGAGSPKTKVR